MAIGNNPLLKEALQLIIKLHFCVGDSLFSKLSITIEVDYLEKSYNFSRYINNLQISLK